MFYCLVRKDMDVNKHERLLFNYTSKHKAKGKILELKYIPVTTTDKEILKCYVSIQVFYFHFEVAAHEIYGLSMWSNI